MKWQILYKMPMNPLWKQKMILIGLMVIHNFIRDHNSGDLDFERVERDENYEPTIPERYTTLEWIICSTQCAYYGYFS
jgi:hypothetical protein